MEFEIVFYTDNNGRNPIEDFISELAKKNRVLVAKTRKGIQLLRHRVYHAEPLSKHIGQGLWELRIRSKTDISRKRLREIKLREVN